MSWTSRLIETYDNYFSADSPPEDPAPLVPVGFIPKKIGIRVYLNRDGSFAFAQILSNEEEVNIPSTPQAEGRTGQPAPYPLCDEIRYVAGDLTDHAGGENYSPYFEAFITQFRNYCETAGVPEEVWILFGYLEQRTLTADLMAAGLLKADADGAFPEKARKKFAEFFVFDGESAYVSLCALPSVRSSWEKYLLTSMDDLRLSYAGGGMEPVLYNHAKIDGNAKLFSQKEGNMSFQFRGRFETAEQAYAVSYSDSAKISSTIRWLRSHCGFRRYGLTFLTWNTRAKRVILPLYEEEDEEELSAPTLDIAESYARAIRLRMEGYRAKAEYRPEESIILLGMETATPGRISVTYYEEMGGKAYLDMLEQWYLSCWWRIWRKDRKNGGPMLTESSPGPHEIGRAVFGSSGMRTADADFRMERSVTRLVRRFYNDILLCIVNGRPMPLSYTMAACRRIYQPNTFTDQKGSWQRFDWENCMAVTLAMLKSSYPKEDYNVSLNSECKDRSYLFGRLAAVADVVETRAMSGSDSGWRQTNAVRYFSAMQQRPAATWKTIETKLAPYYSRLREKGGYLAHLMDEIYRRGDPDEMSLNTPLSPKFLEGYHNQRYELTKKKEN